MFAALPYIFDVISLPFVEISEIAILEYFRKTDNCIERCAQFVTHGRQEFRLCGVRSLRPEFRFFSVRLLNFQLDIQDLKCHVGLFKCPRLIADDALKVRGIFFKLL